MNYYDQQLSLLQEQCARERKLEASRQELQSQYNEFCRQAEELHRIMETEQADVDKLESRSLAAFFYNIMGKMEEKLTAEQQEAYAARIKYDAAARQRDLAQAELHRCTAELAELQGCQERYQALLTEKTQAVKQCGGETAERILQAETRIAHLENLKKELWEAECAGNAALTTADEVLASLGSAESWGTWDLVGGGLIADLAKHNHLDNAQSLVEQLQTQLRTFKTELADVTVQADLQVGIDGFLRFADYFFDGIFADWAVLDRIHQSQGQVQDVKNQISSVLSHLRSMMADADEEITAIRNEIETLVRSVPI